MVTDVVVEQVVSVEVTSVRVVVSQVVDVEENIDVSHVVVEEVEELTEVSHVVVLDVDE